MKTLTIKEFAAEMRVSRATVFVWMKTGVLVKNKHFIKVGKILRFCNVSDLFESAHG